MFKFDLSSQDLRTEYAKYAKAFPFSKQLDVRVPSKLYRRVIGATEILSGLVLIAIPHRRLKNAANVILLFVKGRNLPNLYKTLIKT